MKTIALIFALLASVASAQTTPPSVTPQPAPPPTVTTLVLPQDQIDVIVRLQTTEYLRRVIVERCAVTPCTPVIVPPVVTPPVVPTIKVGNIFSVTSAGVVSGRVAPGSLMVTLTFDGSVVSNVVSTVPSADGVFSVQLPAALKNGISHEITAYAINATGQKALFEQKDGNGATFGFVWQ